MQPSTTPMILDEDQIPLNLRWDPRRINELRKRFLYIIVGERPRERTTLDSAPEIWKRHPNCIYLSDLRIMGRPKDLKLALWHSGIFNDPAEIEDHLDNGITRKNYRIPERKERTGKWEEFEAEVVDIWRSLELR